MKKSGLFLILTILFIVIGVSVSSVVINNKISKNKKLEYKTESNYEIYGIKNEKFESVISIKNDLGIEKIIYPDGRILNSNNKKKVSIDYELEKDIDYEFTVITSEKEEKLTIVGNKINRTIINQTQTYSYPLLTKTGVEIGKIINIEFPQDENNYYSLDDGENWISYKEEMKLFKPGKIKAKSIAPENEITQIATQDITLELAEDALEIEAYDSNNETYISKYHKEYFLDIDSSLIGEKLYYRIFRTDNECRTTIKFYLEDGTTEVWTEIGKANMATFNHIIPEGCYKISYSESQYGTSSSNLYEIGVGEETFKIAYKQYYPKLTTNSKVEEAYVIAIPEYYSTSVQKLYKIGEESEWIDYEGQEIKLLKGEKIYIKGINQYGIETNIESYTATLLEDAIPEVAYDSNNETYMSLYSLRYLDIDKAINGETLYYKIYRSNGGCYTTITFYLEDGTTEVWKETGAINTTFKHVIPEGCYRISYINNQYGTSSSRLYEIGIGQPQQIFYEVKYPTLTSNNVVEAAHAEINLEYFTTSVKRVYKIGNGDWIEYSGETINLPVDETIYVKGIDENGVETNIEEYTTLPFSNPIPEVAYDSDDETYMSIYSLRYFEIDKSINGKTLYYKSYRSHGGCQTTITFYLKDGKTEVWQEKGSTNINTTFKHTIPEGCYRISYIDNQYGTSSSRLYEIGVKE